MSDRLAYSIPGCGCLLKVAHTHQPLLAVQLDHHWTASVLTRLTTVTSKTFQSVHLNFSLGHSSCNLIQRSTKWLKMHSLYVSSHRIITVQKPFSSLKCSMHHNFYTKGVPTTFKQFWTTFLELLKVKSGPQKWTFRITAFLYEHFQALQLYIFNAWYRLPSCDIYILHILFYFISDFLTMLFSFISMNL